MLYLWSIAWVSRQASFALYPFSCPPMRNVNDHPAASKNATKWSENHFQKLATFWASQHRRRFPPLEVPTLLPPRFTMRRVRPFSFNPVYFHTNKTNRTTGDCVPLWCVLLFQAQQNCTVAHSLAMRDPYPDVIICKKGRTKK